MYDIYSMMIAALKRLVKRVPSDECAWTGDINDDFHFDEEVFCQNHAKSSLYTV